MWVSDPQLWHLPTLQFLSRNPDFIVHCDLRGKSLTGSLGCSPVALLWPQDLPKEVVPNAGQLQCQAALPRITA